MIKGVLFQESLNKDPFWMLVACVLVNRTKWMQAEPVFEKIRERWPTPFDLGGAPVIELEKLVQPLGFFKRRSVSIGSLARAYVEGPPRNAEEVMELPGCGKYASDSWAIFVDGRRDVEPTDIELKAWLARSEEIEGG